MPGPLPNPQDILPHRPPFLFVDRILRLDPGREAVGLKVITSNEAQLQGFGEILIYPGVLIVEALAQMTGIVIRVGLNLKDPGAISHLARIDAMRFRAPVRCGHRLILRSRVFRKRGPFHSAKVQAEVKDVIVADGKLTLFFRQ